MLPNPATDNQADPDKDNQADPDKDIWLTLLLPPPDNPDGDNNLLPEGG